MPTNNQTVKTTTINTRPGSVVDVLAPHISVCICTFKRPELLQRLLKRLEQQQAGKAFTHSVVVVDNDRAQSAQEAVKAFASSSSLRVQYGVEPEQNIAMARNRAVQAADGDFIAFIDDDEFPADGWLASLLETQQKFGVDGVLGPVQPHFESDPPAWLKKGKFFDRPDHPTGYKIGWEEARTGNVLFRRSIADGAEPFSPEFNTAGEDVDFFRRMMLKGCSFVWCHDAVVHESVPASRCRRSYLLKRALLRGSNFHKHPSHRIRNVVKSLIAVPCYTVALPVLALFGQHVFFKYLIKILDHGSRLFAYLGLSVVTQRET